MNQAAPFQSFLIIGKDGLLGMALERRLKQMGVVIHSLTHDEVDSLPIEALTVYLRKLAPEMAINVYNRGGGIGKNKKVPADLFMQNISVDMNLLPACHRAGLRKYVNVLPNCIYPDRTPVPFREQDLWSGYPEEIVSYYAMTKKLLMVQADAFRKQYDFSGINLIVTAAYGPYDVFNSEEAQVIPSMISRFDRAVREGREKVEFWGSGKATREFLYADDAAAAILKAALEYNDRAPINICSQEEISVRELAETIARLYSYQGEIGWDVSKPEGIMRKCLSAEVWNRQMGALTLTPIQEGLRRTIEWYHEVYNLPLGGNRMPEITQ